MNAAASSLIRAEDVFRVTAHTGLRTCIGVGDPSAKPVFTGMPGCWTVLMLYEPVRVYSNFINASVHSLCLGI